MIPKHLRYSPVNGMIVTWGLGAKAFASCGLPQPLRNYAGQNISDPAKECCPIEPILEPVDWADWGRWLPEVGVGIADFDEEIAAAYVREAAIEFAREARVIQRSIFLQLQPGVFSYPIEPYENERVVGILAALDGQYELHTGGAELSNRFGATLQHGTNNVLLRQELVERTCSCKHGGRQMIELLVWAAPTEDACIHDKLLYDHYRRVITAHARTMYATAFHFENRPLLATLQPTAIFQQEIKKARGEATAWINASQPRSKRGRVFGGR